jgi:3-oxoacyl-[acyl-carrier-protein] synthase II
VREVVVTGMGAVTPLGVGARTLHERWTAGAVGVRDGEAPCADFQPSDFLSKKEQRRADRFTQLALVAAVEALREAGWTDEDSPYAPERSGCIVGTGIGGIGTIEDAHTILGERGAQAVPPLAVPLMMSNARPAAIAMRHGLKGQVYGTVSACAAGAHAIGAATRAIQYGDADTVVTGGAEAALTPLSRAAFAALDAVSKEGRSLPFDARRDGFVMGEGAGILVLEEGRRPAPAGRRSSDASGLRRHVGRLPPHGADRGRRGRGGGDPRRHEGRGPDPGRRGLRQRPRHVDPAQRPLGDLRAEGGARRAGGQIPISSTKSAIGHLLGAAGAVEAVATFLALRDRIAPPTIGYEEAEEGMDLDYVPNTARPLDVPDGRPAVALSNSFGFGGHNVVLCLEAV